MKTLSLFPDAAPSAEQPHFYVDELIDYGVRIGKAGPYWCHLITDGTPEQLHAFAASLGLMRSYASDHTQPKDTHLHYDLTPSKRALALRKGAIDESKLPSDERLMVIRNSPKQHAFNPQDVPSKVSSRVVHVNRDRDFDVYIGRPMSHRPDLIATGWGNPFRPPNAITRYLEWIQTQPQLLARLPELRGKVLGCWCAPKGGIGGDLHGRICHGQVLAALADALLPQEVQA